jgi:hypothetical protein
LRSQTIGLLEGELKHEIRWKTFDISPDLFIEARHRYSVEICQGLIEHHPMTPQQQDRMLNRF